ncbi:Hypothetical predicted protein [Lecanosticta acicola]|uniref:Uncharacterized protein n=1 Tax=Lecanosticta acicola TaxID=111012 RepID=A0AAI9EBQ9_9PEZI|nr:Hypothetical predicted protein [Lecanosticta acicola]
MKTRAEAGHDGASGFAARMTRSSACSSAVSIARKPTKLTTGPSPAENEAAPARAPRSRRCWHADAKDERQSCDVHAEAQTKRRHERAKKSYSRIHRDMMDTLNCSCDSKATGNDSSSDRGPAQGQQMWKRSGIVGWKAERCSKADSKAKQNRQQNERGQGMHRQQRYKSRATWKADIGYLVGFCTIPEINTHRDANSAEQQQAGQTSCAYPRARSSRRPAVTGYSTECEAEQRARSMSRWTDSHSPAPASCIRSAMMN